MGSQGRGVLPEVKAVRGRRRPVPVDIGGSLLDRGCGHRGADVDGRRKRIALVSGRDLVGEGDRGGLDLGLVVVEGGDVEALLEPEALDRTGDRRGEDVGVLGVDDVVLAARDDEPGQVIRPSSSRTPAAAMIIVSSGRSGVSS